MGASLKLLAFLVWLIAGTAQAVIDPTAPPALPDGNGTGAAAPAGLAWVRVDGKQSLAWYGGTVVRLGDVVEGGRVVAIREDHIVIAGRQGRRVVYLLDQAVRVRQSKNKR